LYSVDEILFAALAASVAGSESWNDTELFAKTHIYPVIKRIEGRRHGAQARRAVLNVLPKPRTGSTNSKSFNDRG
jgi:hypothetical protein